jgi:hypothetical protein
MLVLLQNYPNRLKIDQALELDAIICQNQPSHAKPGVEMEEECAPVPHMSSYSAEDAVVVANLDIEHLMLDPATAANTDAEFTPLETIAEEEGEDECRIYKNREYEN